VKPENDQGKEELEQVQDIDFGIQQLGWCGDVFLVVLDQVIQRHGVGVNARQLAVNWGAGEVLGGADRGTDQNQAIAKQLSQQGSLLRYGRSQSTRGNRQVIRTACFRRSADAPEHCLSNLAKNSAPESG